MNFRLCRFLILLLFIQTSSSFVYHGKNRFWTIEDGEITYFALHQFQGDTKFIFQNRTTFPEIFTFTTCKRNCNDTGMLNFKFIIDYFRYLRGEIKVDQDGELAAFLYQNCPGKRDGGVQYYGPSNFERGKRIEVKECFEESDITFAEYDEGKNAMNFQVNGTFDCPAFFVLPSHMNLEDETPDEAPIRLPLSSTFAGHEDGYWWKTKNDDMLPKGVSFDAENNTVFDINQMNSSDAIFLRIGQNQPIPTFEFSFKQSCSGSSFDLFLNDNLNLECRIGIKLVPKGFYIMTKRIASFFISHLSGPISMVFDAEAVYVKIRDPISITRFDTCKIVNNPADQLSIRVSKSASGDGICDNAELRLLSNDVADGIEVLVDLKKLVALNPPSTERYAVGASGFAASEENNSSFPWYWIIVAIVFAVLAFNICLCIFFYIRRRQRNHQGKYDVHDQPTAILIQGNKVDEGKEPENASQSKKMKKKTAPEDDEIKKRSKPNNVKVLRTSETNDEAGATNSTKFGSD